MVGGVSIGAFMGALWCQERNITTVTQKAREWAKVCCSNGNLVYKSYSSLFLSENDSMVAANIGLNLSSDFNV